MYYILKTNLRKSIAALLLLSQLPLFAQYTLTKSTNFVRQDSLILLEMPFTGFGCEGENVTWNFSNISTQMSDSIIVNGYEMDNHILWDKCGELTAYQYPCDSLLISRVETPQYEMDYSLPITSMVYPMNYGKVVRGFFHGNGRFGHHLQLEEDGTVILTADGSGLLISPDADTLNNVLRVKTSLTSTIGVTRKSTGESVGTLNRNQIICEWYSRGYRYPILRSMTDNVSCHGKLLRQVQRSYWMPPAIQTIISDAINDEIRQKESTNGTRAIDCSVSIDGQKAKVKYSLSSNAHVCILLSDSQSILYWRYDADESTGQSKQVDIPLSGLYRGEYVVYVYIDGEVKSFIIHKD